MTAVTLHRTDPARRMRRFYLLDQSRPIEAVETVEREHRHLRQAGPGTRIRTPSVPGRERVLPFVFRGAGAAREPGTNFG